MEQTLRSWMQPWGRVISDHTTTNNNNIILLIKIMNNNVVVQSTPRGCFYQLVSYNQKKKNQCVVSPSPLWAHGGMVGIIDTKQLLEENIKNTIAAYRFWLIRNL